MPRSLRVRHDCIDKVKVAILQSGYPNQKALSHDTGLSLTTVSKFLTGKSVDYANFEELCRKLNLNWQEITTTAVEVISTPPRINVNTQKKTIYRLGNSN
ncbi:helix-turn-helix transcriptional regulator [Dolichospermum sp. UHCC 0259]|uniref:helix-turn-helix domain-containing protein n=1 Tax=Dolichospermum sp. UHCC 0259 TaxID=2590010 RepID=UPI0014470213|nr:helix-turn-helix transcriptional regulator [Dolichospermum sp. UHCC 0259]MTJ47293.1 helix-turn-helix transcriptional regulator [Dolichospermum sp. UHCC 0259]